MRVTLGHLSVGEWNTETGPAWGDQKEWWAHVPRLHRVLANPEGGEEFCALPPSDAPHQDFLAYWFPSLYLLVYSFGWTLPGKGIKWWFDAGRPTDDPRLELLELAWDRGGNQLDLLAAWLWTNGLDHLSYQLGEMRRLCGLEGEAHPDRVDPGPRWWAAFHERYPEEPVDQRDPPYDPFHGGTDSLHLARHINSPLERQKGAVRLVHSDPSSRRAVLIVEEMAGWYANLASAGTSLPDIGSHSWYVDVVCKPVGWLGTYRRSRQTGLWFAGNHRYHQVGN